MAKKWQKKITDALLKPFKKRSVPKSAVNMGADFAGSAEAQPTYDVNQAMSAYAGLRCYEEAILRRFPAPSESDPREWRVKKDH